MFPVPWDCKCTGGAVKDLLSAGQAGGAASREESSYQKLALDFNLPVGVIPFWH